MAVTTDEKPRLDLDMRAPGGMKLLADYYVAQFAEGQFRVIDKHFRSERNAEFSPNHQHQLHIIQTVQTKLLQRHICRQPRSLPPSGFMQHAANRFI